MLHSTVSIGVRPFNNVINGILPLLTRRPLEILWEHIKKIVATQIIAEWSTISLKKWSGPIVEIIWVAGKITITGIIKAHEMEIVASNNASDICLGIANKCSIWRDAITARIQQTELTVAKTPIWEGPYMIANSRKPMNDNNSNNYSHYMVL